MLYYETDDNKGKVIGAVAGVAYVLLWIVLMFIVKFGYEQRTFGEGILIDFGDVEFATGDMDTALTPEEVFQQQQAPSQSGEPEDYLTQDFEEAPEIQQRDTETRTPAETNNRDNTRNEEPTPVPEERRVNTQALFPGRTENSNSPSEGTAVEGQGNQGALEGAPGGSHDGTGTGGSGIGFDLTGRTVVGRLQQPVYGANKQGRVIIEIRVDAAGKVVSASYKAVGSTTNDSELVNAAINAARQSRFNEIEGDVVQIGTITYNFRLK